MEGNGKTFLAFLCFAEGFASAEATKGLSARPLETFGALLLERIGFFTKTRFLVEGRGKTLLAFPCFAEGFASAEATKGLSGRPLETFGPLAADGNFHKEWIVPSYQSTAKSVPDRWRRLPGTLLFSRSSSATQRP